MARSRKSSRDAEKAAKYDGFKGAWDDQLDAFVFLSMEERDRYQVATYGAVRNGFRHEHEPVDSRPLLFYPDPFWESSEERAAWLRAVDACPLEKSKDLDMFVYLAEVGALALSLPGGLRKMPRTRLTRAEMDARLRLLREQAERLKGGGA